jgi:hypothetical protein
MRQRNRDVPTAFVVWASLKIDMAAGDIFWKLGLLLEAKEKVFPF